MIADLCNTSLLADIKRGFLIPFLEQAEWLICVVISLFVSHPAISIFSLTLAVLLYYLCKPVNIIRDLSDCGYDHLRNRAMRRERSVRVLSEEVMRDRYRGELPPVYPNGWIPLLESRLLRKGQVQSIRAIGQEFAVFRDVDGKSHVMDAYCPHLGANLGVGGRVIGKCLECPFHGWQFRGEDGACTKIPYAEKVPEFVRLKKWASTETNGFIFVWFHAEGEEPSWYPPDIPQINDGSWSFRGRTQHIVSCHIQEIPENGADMGHLYQIHTAAVPCGADLRHMYDSRFSFMKHSWQLTWKAEDAPGMQHIASISLRHSTYLFGKRLPLTDIDLSIKQIGPAFVHLYFKTLFGEGVLVQCITPEAPLRQRMVHACFAQRRLPQFACNMLLKSEDIMVGRDIMVWNNKKYQKKPVLIKEERTLGQHRRWYSQFYSENSPTFESEMRKLNGETTRKYDW